MISFSIAIVAFSLSLYLLAKTFVLGVNLIFRTVEFVIKLRKR